MVNAMLFCVAKTLNAGISVPAPLAIKAWDEKKPFNGVFLMKSLLKHGIARIAVCIVKAQIKVDESTWIGFDSHIQEDIGGCRGIIGPSRG